MIDITVQSLSKIYHSGEEQLVALNDLSFHIAKGSFTSIIGQSGSGKTTLLNIIAGLDQPSCGEVLWNAQKTSEWKTKDWDKVRNNQIGFVFQNFMLLEEFTALENIMLPHYIQTNNKKLATQKALYLLEKIGLVDKSKRYPKELSGGESQRIAIARAIINDPHLVLSDEPTGNLDEKNQQLVMETLLSLHKETQFTFIMVTHNLKLAHLSSQTLELSFGTML